MTTKAAKPKSKFPLKGIKVALIAFAIGVVLGIGGVLYVQHSMPKQETVKEPDSTTVVFNKVISQNELNVASQTYTEVNKVSDVNKFFDFEIPFTGNSFWYRSVGTIKMSVNLSKMQLKSQDGNKLVVKLEQPYISSNTPDMDKSGVLEESNNILNPIHIDEVDSYRAGVQETIEQSALQGDIAEQARANTAQNLSDIFSLATGEKYEVTVDWVDSGTL